MGAQLFSVETYLTTQILEMIGLGPLHVLTWAANSDPDHWMQVSVHGGETCYVMVQCVLPERVNKSRVDKAFGQMGWTHIQMDKSDCLVYYLARTESFAELREHAEDAAKRCAAAMRTLWSVTKLDQLVLLGARGPRIPLHATAVTTSPALVNMHVA